MVVILIAASIVPLFWPGLLVSFFLSFSFLLMMLVEVSLPSIFLLPRDRPQQLPYWVSQESQEYSLHPLLLPSFHHPSIPLNLSVSGLLATPRHVWKHHLLRSGKSLISSSIKLRHPPSRVRTSNGKLAPLSSNPKNQWTNCTQLYCCCSCVSQSINSMWLRFS